MDSFLSTYLVPDTGLGTLYAHNHPKSQHAGTIISPILEEETEVH